VSYDRPMAERVGVTRVLVLIGFLIAAIGFGVLSLLVLPDSWSWNSYETSVLTGLLATALFCALFGWAFWLWLPGLGESYGALSDQRRALQIFAGATLLLTVAYAAESYRIIQLLLHTPFEGRTDEVAAAGYSVVLLGFGTAAVGFWATSTAMRSDGRDGQAGIRGPFPFRIRTCLIGVGLVAGGVGWVISTWPQRVAYDGATAKSILISGFANAAALVVMAPGFGWLLRRQVHSDPRQSIRVPLSILGCAFLSLFVSNLAFFWEDWRVLSGSRVAASIGSVLQTAGALATAVGFLASAWAAGSNPTRTPHALTAQPVRLPPAD
jgi:hypothetical protein